jgi:WD40 repeat protein
MMAEEKKLSVNEQGEVLQAFSRTLDREAHTLIKRPDLLWQQLYNRLQWAREPVTRTLEPELRRRNTLGAVPWLRTRTRLRESEALIRTLAGHDNSVLACAISPNGAFIVSASRDSTLKIWDAATGAERATLTGHTDWVYACAISPDEAFVVSASDDKTLKIWDAATGAERATLTGHTDLVYTCAISSDGALIVSASRDNTLKIWDAATGAERATLARVGGLTCLALHQSSPLAVCGEDGEGPYLEPAAL